MMFFFQFFSRFFHVFSHCFRSESNITGQVLDKSMELRKAVTMRRDFVPLLPEGTKFFHPLCLGVTQMGLINIDQAFSLIFSDLLRSHECFGHL